MVCQTRPEEDQVGEDRRPQVPLHQRREGVRAAEAPNPAALGSADRAARAPATHGLKRTWPWPWRWPTGKCEVSFSVEQLAPRDWCARSFLGFDHKPRLYAKELATTPESLPGGDHCPGGSGNGRHWPGRTDGGSRESHRLRAAIPAGGQPSRSGQARRADRRQGSSMRMKPM